MKTKAIGYVRVSTDEQADKGVSLDAQRAKLQAYAQLADLEFVEIIEDAGVSGKSLDRSGVQRALSFLEHGDAEALVVYKLDRLSRSTRDVLDLAERSKDEGWTLHSLSEKLDTSSAAGRFTLTILAALAEMERGQIVERTRAALAHLKATGKRTGAVPFGSDVVTGSTTSAAGAPNTLAVNEAEAAIIREIAALDVAGQSRRAIAAALNARGERTKAGRAWTHVQVGRILARS